MNVVVVVGLMFLTGLTVGALALGLHPVSIAIAAASLGFSFGISVRWEFA